MKILSVFDDSFSTYGRMIQGLDTAQLLRAMEAIPMPASGTEYAPSLPALEAASAFHTLRDSFYGGMPIQIGCCWGSNTKLNCLEYHRDSEVNISDRDFVLLVASQKDVRNGNIHTGRVEAFDVPAGVPVELYATTLHYAPCDAAPIVGFRVAVVLPKGTNTTPPKVTLPLPEDRLLWAKNKWLIAHPESAEAAQGAFVGLLGDNIDIAKEMT